EEVMTIHRLIITIASALTFIGAAHAGELKPVLSPKIDLGGISGVAYYTVERDGFHVVATLAQGEAGTPIRVVSVLAPGQRVVLSTPQQADAIEISRKGDSVLVRKASAVSN